MKKLIFAVAVIAFSTAAAQAQSTSKSSMLSLGVNAGIPTTTGYSFAYGVDLQADFAVASTTKITASAGYENYSVKSSLGGGNFGAIPLLGGVKFNLGEKAYAHGQLGYGIFTKGGGGAFAYAPSLGYYFSRNFDASIKYLAMSKSGSNLGSVNLRLAYNF
ncbi:MAG: hypothetical protein M3Z26_14420 [Bacteroidota bacterium]|nr:hypothetical protein [Bacteroidota bacterium]